MKRNFNLDFANSEKAKILSMNIYFILLDINASEGPSVSILKKKKKKAENSRKD